jgi:hypothetical protein
VVLVLAAVLVPLVARSRSAVPQPIAFNHLKHTQDLGLNCEFCHKYVRTSAHAGLPGAETCSMCHQVTQGTSEEAARVTELLTEGIPLQFNKLFRLPDHVFYTHRRHAGIGTPASASSNVRRVTVLLPRPSVHPTGHYWT